MKATCTQELQKFHHPNSRYKQSPIKAEEIVVAGTLEAKTEVLDVDDEYTRKVASLLKNYAGQNLDNLPLMDMVVPANPYSLDLEHDYNEEIESDHLLQVLHLKNVSTFVFPFFFINRYGI